MRISDWSSDVCSSDLPCEVPADVQPRLPAINAALTAGYAAGSTMAGDGCRRAPPMTQFAEHVYTAQHDIARIESWAGQLEDEARVEILLADGARVEGFVAARPTTQVFRDGEGREGMNAMVRIDDQANPEHAHYLWLDRIIDMRRTGTAGAR